MIVGKARAALYLAKEDGGGKGLGRIQVRCRSGAKATTVLKVRDEGEIRLEAQPVENGDDVLEARLKVSATGLAEGDYEAELLVASRAGVPVVLPLRRSDAGWVSLYVEMDRRDVLDEGEE